MTPALLVFLGAGFGGLMRHLVNIGAVKLFGLLSFPAATLFINVLGCFLMGVITALFALRSGEGGFWTQHMRLLLTTGMLGGFTTFSTFSLEFALLVERGATLHAAVYALGSLALCLLAVFAGMAAIRAFA